MIDLHTHSNASDGLLSPKDLISFAASKSIHTIALTDHDTIAGIPEAQTAAEENNITFIPGIELDIQWPTGEFHLLGLGLKKPSNSLKDIIAFLRKARNTRNEEIVKKMQNLGINFTLEEIIERYDTESLGRPHIADFLVEKNIVKNRQQAFDKYLARNKPLYVPRVGANLDEAIIAIKESGGVPVIAHPLSLYVSWGKIEPVLQDIFDRGVEGLEAWHPGVRVVDAKRLESMAKKIGFFITAGSDFHGENIRVDRKIGKTSGGLKIEDRFWEEELKIHLK